MESYNQSINGSFPSSDVTEGVPSLVTYLIMVTTLVPAIVVVTPAVTVINVIWQTRQLHTKYFFLVAHMLATKVIWITVAMILSYLIIILYLLDLNSDSAFVALKWLCILPFISMFLMTFLLPVPVAVERMIVIAFPFRHRSIITTKTVAIMLTPMWGLSAILGMIIIIAVPVDIVWPLGFMYFHPSVYLIIAILQVMSTIFILATNSYLQYNVTLSNRKAAENQRLGNEEEVKKFKNTLQEVRAQAKATITLFLVGGIDVIANILQTVTYTAIEMLVEPNKKMYTLIFAYHTDRNQCKFIPNTGIWLVYEEDKKQAAKLDGLLSTMDYPSSQQSWQSTSTTFTGS